MFVIANRWSRFRMFWAALVCVTVPYVLALPVGFAQDPFAEPINPFGSRPGDIKRRDELLEMVRQEERERLAQHYVKVGLERATLLKSADDEASFLEGCLALIHFHRAEVGRNDFFLETVAGLAKRKWSPRADESAKQFVNRLTTAVAGENSALASFQRLAREYDTLTEKPWPFDWRQEESYYLGLVEAVLASAPTANPTEVWQARAKHDKPHAESYWLGYLAVARAGFVKPEQFDFSIAEAFLETRQDPARLRSFWQAEVLETLMIVGVPSRDEHRAALVSLLRDRLPATDFRSVDDPLDLVLQRICAKGDATVEIEPMLAVVLEHGDPQTFRRWATAAGLSAKEQRSRQVQKQVSVDYRSTTISDAIGKLEARVGLPIWIDEQVYHDRTLTAFAQTGPWKDVLEARLKPTEFRLFSLGENLFWIGTPESLAAATTTLKASESKIPAGGRPLEDALRVPTPLAFANTPLFEILDVIGDRDHVPLFYFFTDWDDQRITLRPSQLPLHLTLTLMLDPIGLDWIVSEDEILVGPKPTLVEFEKRVAAHAKRINELVEAGARIGAELLGPTRLEFIETPLSDVSAYLADKHRLEIHFAPGVETDKPLSCAISGKSLAWSLDAMLFRFDPKGYTTWDTDGELVYLGDDAAVRKFRDLADSRAARRRAYPADLADKLQARVVVRFEETALANVVRLLQTKTDLQIMIASDDKLEATVITQDSTLPLDVTLDLLELCQIQKLGLAKSAGTR